MAILDSVLDAVGNTPMVRLSRLGRDLPCELLAKLEFMNPGGSVKDRIGVRMLLEAEKAGRIKPGDTLIEPTSGNTGIGLALAAAVRGYRVIITMPEKMSQEKQVVLEALGAEIIRTPTEAAWDSPDSHIMVARRLREVIPNSHILDQYENPSNPEAHYSTTGPEIWEQTGGKVDVLVAGVGTGGTITGTGRFLKEKKPSVLVVGVDPEGSILASRFKGKMGTPRPYRVEGIGEDFVPGALDMGVIDRMITVSDRDSFLTSRRLAKEEGIIAGGSSGSALHGALLVARGLAASKTVVVILPDSGRSYTDKMFNDDWMAEYGYLRAPGRKVTVEAVLRSKPRSARAVIGLAPKDRLSRAIRLMAEGDISQLPVIKDGVQVGSVTVASMIKSVASNKKGMDLLVEDVMESPLKAVERGAVLLNPASLMRDRNAVVVVEGQKVVGILTTIDVINYLARA